MRTVLTPTELAIALWPDAPTPAGDDHEHVWRFACDSQEHGSVTITTLYVCACGASRVESS